ncbi:Hypothetical_protein [Hexamita inflata]|uniref:Hypothetical_protein n=1 Tax=Hexamita inflata TaxID=28002 RepID=A0AA86R2B5_9EUKA|nr:Hypothetical protein HINF_LOCUS52276 [Hexamita inflata]CAI9964638.1 Hypothetical protein HINF_LOCUS52283 [Hexamita inflata]
MLKITKLTYNLSTTSHNAKEKYNAHKIFPVSERKSEIEHIARPGYKSMNVMLENSNSDECELVWDQSSEVDVRMKRITEINGSGVVSDIVIPSQSTINDTRDSFNDFFTIFEDM